MTYSKTNNLIGWLCFIIATATYVLTLEPSASFWDCGEFISAAYKLQIVHQPGAPLFLMIQKMFSLLAGGNIHKVAYWMNVGSALSSGATILFLFWTITALVKKIIWRTGEELTTGKLVLIMGSGAVGALAYTFSDSFWFSAVESEVYAMSSLCTAIVFWAILKWEQHADEPFADKWIVFIAYVMGLSIGVHLLNLLAIPAIALVYYFKRTPKPTSRGTILTLLIGIVILGVIQYGIIQYLIKIAAYFDLFFVNSLGMGFGTGVAVFAILLIAAIVYGVMYSIRKAKPVLNLALICFAFILVGYSSFAMIIIRAKANPSLNNSDPDNAFAFLSYLNREQYGDRPLAYGPYFDSKAVDYNEGGNIYRKGKEKYEVAGRKFEQVYDRNTLLPRMYSDDPQHVGFYREWMQLGESQSPNFVQNLGFLFSYQTGFMYARYFAWNFVGRQNDEQGNGNNRDGNWITGIKFLDAMHLGPQDHLPQSVLKNKAYNRFFMLPFILGIIGAVWHFKRNQKDAGVVGLLFFFTGMAIVLYLNQTPLQPRERDYAYAGSFYAYAIWIGLGVAGLAEYLFKKLSPANGAIAATVIGLLAAPVVMAKDGWDDHNRSTKTTPRDFAIDYLESCAPNAILFTYGDNDTYPLWYAQEVENVRPDVRIVNLSLLGTDWYINQMKYKVNEATPLPLTMADEKYVQGVRDVIRYNDDYKIAGSVELKNLFDVLVSDDDNDKLTYQDGSKENFLPTKNFKLTINPEQVISTGTVPSNLRDSIAPSMDWTYNKNYITKTELAMIDILAHNDWKRPVYFAVTVPSSNFIGLDKYLYDEGFAYRLMPLKTKAETDSTAAQQDNDKLNTGAMYNNMMNKFVWGNMKNAKYLDPESTRMIGIIMKSFNGLGSSLLSEGKTEEARKAVLKSLDVVPDYNYSMYFTLHRYYTIDLLYKLKETEKANKLVQQTADYLESELNYFYDLSRTRDGVQNDVQLGMSVLNELIGVTAENGQKELNIKLTNDFKSLETKFMSSAR
ncbi:DUF2723 domain-containing protein [Pedobacter sp. HMF7647]|uniref:DUF2723 domain-containing protein n=1 Tax=Hufsiella arboris TaxID=2695275 RepID=A0A7K1Y8L7_9SPHI|nr:DUF2723 domain-containing protein [Hufsiella arboris]MXV50943.1 DUF2723 domain-containing protein [Hufsiella arboris]